jgi:hypothetical protein
MDIKLRNLITVATMTLAAACASTPPEPQTLREAQADFGAYRTFGWHAAAAGSEGGGKPASIVDGYVKTAIASELKAKGYVEAPEGTAPDLAIAWEGASAEKLKNNPFRIGIGVGSYGSSGGGSVGVGSSSVKQVREGSLVVHVIDPARETEVWQGSIERELGKGGIKPEIVQGAVSEVMRDFPARTAPP